MKYQKALADLLRSQVEKRDATGYWYPSQLGQCDRRLVLEHDGIPGNPHDDRTLRLFWLGNAIHAALQASFPFEVVGHEVQFRNEEYRVSGRCDTLARLDGVLEVVEFKSVNSKKFSYNLPDDHHVLQLACYLTWLEPRPDRGRIVYWSKDDARIEEFIVLRTDELDQRVKGEFVRLEKIYQDYKSTGDVPAALPKKDWRPKYCPYAGTGRCCGDQAPVPAKRSLVPDSAPKQQELL